MGQVFVTILKVLDILLKNRDLPVLVIELGLVVLAHRAETLLEQITSLLDFCDLESERVIVPV